MLLGVIDGQGGGLGKAIIEGIKNDTALLNQVNIVAIGTNGIATSTMLKAGAHEGASGENAVTHNAAVLDIITGSFNIVMPNAMLGEVTPAMAVAVLKSKAKKILLPVKDNSLYIAGCQEQPLPVLIGDLVKKIHLIVLPDS